MGETELGPSVSVMSQKSSKEQKQEKVGEGDSDVKRKGVGRDGQSRAKQGRGLEGERKWKGRGSGILC